MTNITTALNMLNIWKQTEIFEYMETNWNIWIIWKQTEIFEYMETN